MQIGKRTENREQQSKVTKQKMETFAEIVRYGSGSRFDPMLQERGGWISGDAQMRQNTTRKWVALFFPYERNTEQVWMSAPVGPFFWPSPFWPLDDFFWFIFLLNLGSTAPNYSRRPL
jgi:hypothetical protein